METPMNWILTIFVAILIGWSVYLYNTHGISTNQPIPCRNDRQCLGQY